MPPANFKRKWIKLWIDECLTGTVREDLTPEERSVWYDFLLIAGRNRPPGCISANEDTEISAKRVAAILNIPMSLLARATAKFVESGRITVDASGIIHITNWEKYQFTDYDRQKPFRQKSKADDKLTTEKTNQERVASMSPEESKAETARLSDEYDRLHPSNKEPLEDEQGMREHIADLNDP